MTASAPVAVHPGSRELRAVRAVLMDVDGTLYDQRPLRMLMALELAALPAARRSWRGAGRAWRALAGFRRVREELRSVGRPPSPLAQLQYEVAAGRLGTEPAELAQLVEEWMYRRPLKYLRWCRRAGLEGFLALLARRGLPAGVFSDHPSAAKIEALGLSGRFSIALSATDLEVNAFKPHPRGFQQACARWSLDPAEVLYVGDRPDVDVPGARGAGMPCAILSPGPWPAAGRSDGRYLRVASFAALGRALG